MKSHQNGVSGCACGFTKQSKLSTEVGVWRSIEALTLRFGGKPHENPRPTADLPSNAGDFLAPNLRFSRVRRARCLVDRHHSAQCHTGDLRDGALHHRQAYLTSESEHLILYRALLQASLVFTHRSRSNDNS